jgi:glycosyltransferase involved in cell wall biosynthesis
MKICVIGKVSPIQGGVSKLNFWICEVLATAGHEVHLITNGAQVEEQYRTIGGRIADDLSNSPLKGLAGRLTIHYTDDRAHYSYIPYADPFVSKLASMAIGVIRKFGCDLIFGHYFEPYGVAAYLASKATGVPFGLQHAGSDIGRLMQSPELRAVYSEIIKAADYIFASNSAKRRFIQEGADPGKLFSMPRPAAAERVYTADVPPLDLAQHLASARAELKGVHYHDILDRFPAAHFDPRRPTIGIYGKTGESKGSYDLIEALKVLKQQGLDFNFLALSNSGKKNLSTFLTKIEQAGLAERTTWLPFVPHWRVPEFIKRCDVVCFLERDFSIPIHHPAIATEVMLCETCLVISDEIAAKQRYKSALKDGENIVVVDPRNIGVLAAKIHPVLADPGLARRIGAAARQMMLEFNTATLLPDNAISARFEEVHSHVLFRKDEQQMIEFQSFVNRLYTDDVFRKLYSVEPEAAQSFFTLTDEEKAMLKKIELRAVTEFASSLKVKARERYFGIFPLTMQVLDADRARRLFDRFYSLNRMYPGEPKVALCNKFGQFLEDSLLAEQGESALSELLRFERQFVQLALATGPADDFSLINLRDQPLVELDESMLISLRSSVHLERYAYDIPAFVDRIKNGETELPPPKHTNVIFVVVANEALPKVLKVNEATIKLLNLTRRKTSLSALTARFAEALGAPARQTDVTEAALFFANSGMLRVDPVPAAV